MLLAHAQGTGTLHICQFWTKIMRWCIKTFGTPYALCKSAKKMRKFATKWPKYAKFHVLHAKKYSLKKSTLPPVVAVVSNMSYGYLMHFSCTAQCAFCQVCFPSNRTS